MKNKVENKLNKILNAVKGSNSKTEPITEIVAGATEKKVTANKKKPGFWENLGKGVLDVAKTAAPLALSALPGGSAIAPLAQTILSTLNDDEWFSEFKSAGATFNELLRWNEHPAVDNDFNVDTVSDLTPALASILTKPNFGEAVKSNVFPSMLSHIRNKTNNVLVDNVDNYWKTIETFAYLYALYYQGRKLIKLSENIPLNVPTLYNASSYLQPKFYSQFKGAVDNLEAYLKTSVALPHAYVMYLRWRFGTAFLSENSARCGIISYDVTALNPEDPIEEFNEYVNYLKNRLVEYGRAAADVKLAYSNHVVKYDVEERHYDEKEFNLRCNSTNVNAARVTKYATILLDSRLDMNAAIQAVTLSIAPSIDEDMVVTEGLVAHNDVFDTPFIIMERAIYYNAPTPYAILTSGSVSLGNQWFKITQNSILLLEAFIRSTDAAQNGYIRGTQFGSPQGTYNQMMVAKIYRVMAIAMQMHYGDVYDVLATGTITTSGGYVYNGETVIMGQPLSYDKAVVTYDQVAAIQKTAMRNLMRGNYFQKENVTPKVVDAVTEVIEAVGGADIDAKQVVSNN